MKTQNSFHHLTDEELVKQITETKNDLLFAVLYERFSSIVYNKCYGFTKTKADAKDLAQDVFVKLYQKLSSFEGRSKFSTWLYSFTYNMCVDYVNKNVLKTVSSDNLELEDYDHLHVDVDDYSLFQMREDVLVKALEAIAPEDKVILLLKYQDDFSIKHIMTVLNIGLYIANFIKKAVKGLFESFDF